MTRTLCVFVCVLGATVIAAQDTGGDPQPENDGIIRVQGRLTAEGVECQAMRATDGTLYTLLGELDGFEAGDMVEVEAVVVEFSFCMQGQTLTVESISAIALQDD